MNKSRFDIDAYLHNAEERFSGFDGDDMDSDFDMEFASMEGDYDEEDYFMASGGGSGASLKAPSPYQITVTNTTGGTLVAILFGKNKFLLDPNFGSATGLIVDPSQSNVEYVELLQQSASQPFETSLIRIQSTNATQVTQILEVTVKDANGQQATMPIITQSYFSSYQQQSGILDVPYQLKVDANTYISFNVLASTTVTLTFFPADKVNIAKGLSGQAPVQTYGNPQVNLGGMSFPKRKAVGRGNAGGNRRRLR